MSAYATKDEYISACRADLAAWLLEHHSCDVLYKYGSVLLRKDNHVSVKPGYHGYTDFRTEETGNNIDYLMNFLGYSYPDAVHALTGLSTTACSNPEHAAALNSGTAKELLATPDKPPDAAPDCRNVIAYLTKQRGIPSDIVYDLMKQGLLYQSKTGRNAVFCTPERDYYELRGTNTYADRRCRHRENCPRYKEGEHSWCVCMESCNDYKASPFHGGSRNQGTRFWYYKPSPLPSERIYVCESAIDAISLYAIHRNHGLAGAAVYTGIGGAAKQSKIDRMKRQHPHVVIATDNDNAGNECRARNRELETITPITKDWNTDLMKGAFYGNHDNND